MALLTSNNQNQNLSLNSMVTSLNNTPTWGNFVPNFDGTSLMSHWTNVDNGFNAIMANPINSRPTISMPLPNLRF